LPIKKGESYVRICHGFINNDFFCFSSLFSVVCLRISSVLVGHIDWCDNDASNKDTCP